MGHEEFTATELYKIAGYVLSAFSIRESDKEDLMHDVVALLLKNIRKRRGKSLSRELLINEAKKHVYHTLCKTQKQKTNQEEMLNMQTEEARAEASIDAKILLARLHGRTKEIIRMRFGLGRKELSVEEIASKLHISCSRVYKVIETAINRMR